MLWIRATSVHLKVEFARAFCERQQISNTGPKACSSYLSYLLGLYRYFLNKRRRVWKLHTCRIHGTCSATQLQQKIRGWSKWGTAYCRSFWLKLKDWRYGRCRYRDWRTSRISIWVFTSQVLDAEDSIKMPSGMDRREKKKRIVNRSIRMIVDELDASYIVRLKAGIRNNAELNYFHNLATDYYDIRKG